MCQKANLVLVGVQSWLFTEISRNYLKLVKYLVPCRATLTRTEVAGSCVNALSPCLEQLATTHTRVHDSDYT